MTDEQIENIKRNLQKYWGYTVFRPGQEQVITSVLGGKDTVVLFPTGGGKSLCYQLPATLLDGLTLVISPLIALMQDQVEQLNKAGIRSTFINSSIPSFEIEQRLINARNGMYRLLYVSPERLGTLLWEQMMPDLNIALVAVDEAHCISHWGHDFRPAYRKIRTYLERLAETTRWMALTATATPKVRDDIIANLHLLNPEVVARGFERPNLKWWVIQTPKKKQQLIRAVSKGVKTGSGIVYTATRQSCNELAKKLSGLKIPSKPYHAGLSNDERNAVQRGWVDGVFPVVVATNAFGMGIDKPDCRFVIHYDIPYTLEAYYQEAGRAGRDGETAYPVLLFKESDYQQAVSRLLRSYPDLESLRNLYDALCDELNLAVGSEMEQATPVSTEGITRRSSISGPSIHSGLKVLERMELIEIIKQSEAQLGIRFIVNKEILREVIEKAKPLKAEFLDMLFRQFGPMAFQKFYYLDLPYLTQKLHQDEDQLLKDIDILASHDQLLEYHFLDKEPMIRLTESRASVLPATREDVEYYREILLEKLEYMKQYALTGMCRELFLRQYFGDGKSGDCGHCDVCLQDDQNSEAHGKQIQELLELLEEPKTVSELLQITNWNRRRMKRAIQFLVRENYIVKSGTTNGAYRRV